MRSLRCILPAVLAGTLAGTAASGPRTVGVQELYTWLGKTPYYSCVFEQALAHDIGSLAFTVCSETLLAYARHDSVSDGDIPLTDLERFAFDSGEIAYEEGRFTIESNRKIEMRVLLRRKPDLHFHSTPRLVLDVVHRERVPGGEGWGYAVRRTEGAFSLRLGFPGSLLPKLPLVRDVPCVEEADYAVLLPGPPPGCLQFLRSTNDGSLKPLTEICSIHMDHVDEREMPPEIHLLYGRLLDAIRQDAKSAGRGVLHPAQD